MKNIQKNNANDLCCNLKNEKIRDAKTFTKFLTTTCQELYDNQSPEYNSLKQDEAKILKGVFSEVIERPENFKFKLDSNVKNLTTLGIYIVYLRGLKQELSKLAKFINKNRDQSVFVGDSTSNIYEKAAKEIDSKLKQYNKKYVDIKKVYQEN